MSQEPTSRQDPTPITPQDPTGPEGGAGPHEATGLTGYAPAPPMRSAYPTAAEGGFHADPVHQPPAGAPPGPGYGDRSSQTAAAPAGTGAWMLLGVLAALLLGLGTLLALDQWPPVTTVAVGVLGLAVGVLSWPARVTIRRAVLIAAAGPVGVLIGYWVIVLFRG